jgi:hypothetical protein
VFVVGRKRGLDAKMGKQLAGMARVLGRDHVGAGEHGKRAQRNVGEIADRRRHEIEAGCEWLGDQPRKHGLGKLGRVFLGFCVPVSFWMVLHAPNYSVESFAGTAAPADFDGKPKKIWAIWG